jgi:hypothetical protein
MSRDAAMCGGRLSRANAAPSVPPTRKLKASLPAAAGEAAEMKRVKAKIDIGPFVQLLERTPAATNPAQTKRLRP